MAAVLIFTGFLWVMPDAFAADPFAANNGLYPTAQEWQGPYRVSNYNYPETAESAWLKKLEDLRQKQPQLRGKLTPDTAGLYVDALKQFLEPSMEAMIDRPDKFDPAATNWYSMPWTGEGSPTSTGATDSTSGREAILGSFSGQVIQGSSFKLQAMAMMLKTGQQMQLAYPDLLADMQNHTVIYYDPVAALMLRKVWADPLNPNARAADFPEGALVIKAGAVTATESQWPVVKGSAIWHVFRPPFQPYNDPNPPSNTPKVTELRVLQFDAIVKDSIASPDTGWVFITWVYKFNAPGPRPWDRLVALGAMWGNDPELAQYPDGVGPSGKLQETWINPDAPDYARKTLGWGGRLSGPIDVSLRHGIVFTNGQIPGSGVRASSCMSCHGTSQYPFVANLYPSPNKIFPKDGDTFLLYPPGSREWSWWFANRPGKEAQNKANDVSAVGLDYDMLLTFALSNFNNASGHPALVQPRFRVH
ncbi:hypothetical protein GCM10007874_14730 [Labrys miyagiensis]|uniref:Cytochrome c domain-containing protein n=1 Tax=Labrys miyagiensis TaxID=346912 RepID=A0ABQ6CJR3_9HYPH|nr:hypothetical protein [Labrys miyagiensis]GLS18456.1 hypothetical protein GCM10007874_14730 [Labrys miyagiensis]